MYQRERECVYSITEKNPFNGKQSQIAKRKTVGEQGPGDHGKEAAEQKKPMPTPLTGREHVGGGSRGNNLIQTGYHTTKPNQQARKTSQNGENHNPDREKNTAGSLLTLHRPAHPHTPLRPPRPPPPALPGPRTQPKTEEPAPGPRPGEPRPRPGYRRRAPAPPHRESLERTQTPSHQGELEFALRRPRTAPHICGALAPMTAPALSTSILAR
jgi:hypothetical protein